ncbi:TIGR03621 family F420-dependent LLM class oxidoreductase [Streptomyces sp. NPDC127172]|uniref:TIGR03621 family F420-dependent LLM class oxidoreductase n=1 Tax=Streptomyces sp. NPDC127172 TaxID=3345382 RepID=UPI003640DBCE
MAARPFHFGAVVRLASSGKEWAEKARRLEDAGFDVLLVPDHFTGPRFAPVAAMMAAANATTRLRIGTMVFSNDYRHPVVLAKEAATLDVLSEGRLELGIGTGWMRKEYDATGIQFDPPKERFNRLKESLKVMKGCWSEGAFSFQGEHYTITDLVQDPKPVQKPYPRILLGGGGPGMLRLAAREADVVNLAQRVLPDGSAPDPADGGLENFLRKIDIIRDAAGDRFERIELGTSIQKVGGKRAVASWSEVDLTRADDTPQVLIGDTSQMVDKLQQWRTETGLTYFVLHNETDLDDFLPVVTELAGR